MYFTVWWKGPGSISDFACSDPATAVSFKLIRQKSQLYRKQQHKITIIVQNTAERSSLLSTQLHFLKLFVQTESADGSCSQSPKYWKITRWLHTSIYAQLYLEFWISYSNFILYLCYHRTFQQAAAKKKKVLVEIIVIIKYFPVSCFDMEILFKCLQLAKTSNKKLFKNSSEILLHFLSWHKR